MSYKIEIEEMLNCGVHFGHRLSARNPKMDTYIYGKKNGIQIINLRSTMMALNNISNVVCSIVERGGNILFVGTKRVSRDLIRSFSEKCGMPCIDHRWLGGTLTNYKTIKKSVKTLKNMETFELSSQFADLTKKEKLAHSKKKLKLELNLGGIRNMNGLPSALFVIDAGFEKTAITEANKLRIPVIAVVDTNSDPSGVDYIIPGNDDARRSIELYCNFMAESVIAAKAKHLETEQKKYETLADTGSVDE